MSCRLVNFVQSNAHSIIYQLQQLQAKVRDLTARGGAMVGYGQQAGAGLACQPEWLINADYLIAGALQWRAEQCGVGGAAKEADIGIRPSLAKDVRVSLLDFI